MSLTIEPSPTRHNRPNSLANSSDFAGGREDFSDYVAQLQLHMALQARKLVPSLTQPVDHRQQLLQQTQADIEKLVSRQAW